MSDDHVLAAAPVSFAHRHTITVFYAATGTVLDLPYRFGADDDQMRIDKGFNMQSLLGNIDVGTAAVACGCLALLLAGMLSDN
jgi:hypothetical protein